MGSSPWSLPLLQWVSLQFSGSHVALAPGVAGAGYHASPQDDHRLVLASTSLKALAEWEGK